MKAQGLPMSTIILFILVLLVLVGVGIFFFTQFATGEKGVSGANCLQLCQSVNAYYASNTSMTEADVKSSTVWKEFDAKCDGVDCIVGSWTFKG